MTVACEALTAYCNSQATRCVSGDTVTVACEALTAYCNSQATRCVSGDTVTVACEALTAYCANIDRISVMYFMEPVKRGCGWPIIIVPTTEDPLCRPAGGQMGTAGSGGRPLQYFVSFSVLVRLTL